MALRRHFMLNRKEGFFLIVKYDDPKEKMVYVDEPLTKEIVRTIECKPPIVQKAVFHRTATVDYDTLSVEAYSEWEAENSTWDRVEIAKKEGYDVSPKVVEAKEVNANAENETVLVKYEETFKEIKIKKDEPYAKRKQKPRLPPVEGNEKNEEIKNVEKPKEEEKSGESSGLDALSSKIKENMLKRIVKKEESESVDKEKKTDSETLPSTKESSLSKAKQSIISKTNEKAKQKEAFRNYQQQKYHEKMNAHIRNVRVQKPIQINDIGRFSAETIDFLNELKEIGEEALTREKWKVTLFAK